MMWMPGSSVMALRCFPKFSNRLVNGFLGEELAVLVDDAMAQSMPKTRFKRTRTLMAA